MDGLASIVPTTILILFWELPQSADSSISVSSSCSPVSADYVSKAGSTDSINADSKAGSEASSEKSVSFVSLIFYDADGCSVAPVSTGSLKSTCSVS